MLTAREVLKEALKGREIITLNVRELKMPQVRYALRQLESDDWLGSDPISAQQMGIARQHKYAWRRHIKIRDNSTRLYLDLVARAAEIRNS